MPTRDHTVAALAGAFVVFVAAGFFLPSWAVSLVIVSLARGIVALGLVVQFRSGLVSFGQALFFAIGGYAVGLAGLKLRVTDMIVLPLIGVAAATLLGAGLGFLMRRYRDIFFAMLSLGFSMLLYGLLVKTETLGSTDGFNVPTPTVFGSRLSALATRTLLYDLTVVASAAVALAVHWYLGTILGRLDTALRDNEVRVEYLGYAAARVIHVQYVLGAALAGGAGALTAMAVGHIDPTMAYWTTSGELVFITILSGTGSVFAPFLGSLVFSLIQTFALQYAPSVWQMILGLALLAIILYLPGGLWSALERSRVRA
jgi:ABC-type branched-subunit amino acid transport system permease subunit